jgi:uncharacterized membrane protein
MEEILKGFAEHIALGVEAGAVLLIAYGALEALWNAVKAVVGGEARRGQRKAAWRGFGVWLLLGLEFELAADIVRSVVTPTWGDIGQLAAIGAIRTFLNYFLEKDIERYGEAGALKERSRASVPDSVS